MKFPQWAEDVQYTLVSVISHDSNSMSSGNYYCGVLYFNTGIYWHCDEYNITLLELLPDNMYSDPEYQKIKPNKKVVMISSEKIVSIVYIKINIVTSNNYDFFVGWYVEKKHIYIKESVRNPSSLKLT